MEAGTLAAEQKPTLGERFSNAVSRFNEAPYVVKAGLGVFLLDLVLVIADRWPDSFGEWILLLAIFAVTVAAMVPFEARPAAIAAVVLGNVVAVLILYHGLHEVAQRGINGLSLGAIYALGAVGLTLVYGILKLVNFAHGDFLTFGAYMAYVVNVTWELPLIFGIVFAILTTALLATSLEKVMWAPMQLIVIIVGFVTLIATGFMLRLTLLGKQMRALSDNLDLAETSGINTSRVILYTWLFAGGLAGLAGVFAGAITQLQPELGFELLLPIFAAVVLGGIGNAFGALTAGIVLGVVIEWSTLFISSGLKLAVGFIILIIVLIIRPEGIFGRARTV